VQGGKVDLFRYMNIALYHAGDSGARIIKNGRYGWIMKRRSLILN